MVSLRLAQQPITLHDGLILQKGTRIAFPAQSCHFDPENYKSPQEFLPFRFAGTGPCDCSADGVVKEAGRLKSDAPDEAYLPFGYGRQSCPGRFFAMRVVKLIVTRLVDEFDMKSTGTLPKSPTDGSMKGFFLPIKRFEVCLRSRQKG